MVDQLKPFKRGFNSGDHSEETTRATADWVTNALRMRVPADDTERMTVAAAFISREEFLHGQWVVAIIHSLAHLSLAANDALQSLVTADQDLPADEAAYLEVIEACEETQTELLDPMKPFVEAVDKFQLLSVIDEEFVSAVRDTYEAAEGEEATEEFDEYFYKTHEQEIEIATGQDLPDGDEVYVNPLYFHALSDIVVTDWTGDSDELDAGTGGNSAQGRAIAEAVARATLDVPNPIGPLGTEEFDWFDPLCTPDVELDPLSPADLVSDERYSMTPSEFERYLGDYPKASNPGGDDDGEFNGALVDDIDFEYTYEDAKDDWVARAFVNTRRTLDELRDDDSVDLGEIDPADLRELLVERVHGVDVETSATMLDQPTALLDIPRQIETNVPDEDVMSAEGKPLPKVLMEAFEHHGSFGAVVYNLSEDDTKYQLNWHIRDQTVDPDQYQHVPEGTETYGELWHHHYLWQGLYEHLWDRDAYREHLIEMSVAELDTVEETELLVSQIEGRLSDTGGRFEDVSSSTRAAADSKAVVDEPAETEGFEAGTKDHYEQRTLLESKSARFLQEVVDEQGLDTERNWLDCPLCRIRSTPCGADGDCGNKDLLRTYESRFPDLLDRFTTL